MPITDDQFTDYAKAVAQDIKELKNRPTSEGNNGSSVDTFATLNGNLITFADGQEKDITPVVDTDTDTFATISGGIITFPNGDVVNLNSFGTDTFATLNGNTLTLADGQIFDLTKVVDTDTDTFATLSGNTISFPDGSSISIPTGDTGSSTSTGYGHSLTFMLRDSTARPTQFNQYSYYDELRDLVVFDWSGHTMVIKTDNLRHNGTLFLTATDRRIELGNTQYAYVLESDLQVTSNHNVPVYYGDTLFGDHLGTEGRVLIAIRDTNNPDSISPEKCSGPLAEYLNNLKNSAPDQDNNNFYSLGLVEKDYSNPSTKYGVIVAGDSIVDGRVDLSEANSWLNQDSPIVPNVNMWDVRSSSFNPLEFGANTGSSNKNSTQWGWDTEAAYNLQDYINDEVYVVKESLGGSKLRDWWLADFNRIDIESGFNALTSVLETSIRNAEQKAKEDGVVISWRSFILSFGANDTSLADISEFETNLYNIVQYIRGVVGNPKLTVVIPNTPRNSSRYRVGINGSLDRISKKDPYFKVVNTPDVSFIPDGLDVHPDASGNTLIGEEVFDLIKDIKQEYVIPIRKLPGSLSFFNQAIENGYTGTESELWDLILRT